MIGSKLNSYTRITSVTTNTMQISRNVTSTGSADVYIYQGKGLINHSLISFCLPAQTRCLKLTQSASVGDTELFVQSGDAFDEVTTGANGWDAQGSAFDGGSSDITQKNTNPDGTFSIIVGEALVKPIASGGNFTATSASDNRILCCPPTDTSPPFEAIETGLRTTSSDPKLRLSQGNLIFDNLSATIDTGNVSSATATSSAERSILIETGVTAGDPTDTNNQGTTFKILCAPAP